MRKSRFFEEQIISVLAESEREMATSKVCYRCSIVLQSERTHTKSGTLSPAEFEMAAE